MKVATPLLRALGLVLTLAAGAGCKSKDGTPDATVRTTWRAAIEGNEAAFRATYPTQAELEALFEPTFAKSLLEQIELGAKGVPSKPPRINITEIKIEKEADVPPGNGLLKPSRFARVRLKIELPRVEPEDDVMTLVRIGESWRALPKAAAKLLP